MIYLYHDFFIYSSVIGHLGCFYVLTIVNSAAMNIWIHVSFFFFYFILLYNTVLVLPYIDMNPPRVYMSSQSWISLSPPTPYHLSGSSPCTSPKHPVSCIEHRLAIRFLHDSIHVMYVCNTYNAILPHHPTLSLRVQKSVLYICVSFAVSHTGSWLPSF